jgi:Golgi SNAP receptor complex protein 2
VLQNTISANLSRLHKTISEYETLIGNQPADADETTVLKSKTRLANFHTEQAALISQFNDLKQKRRDQELTFNRSELLHRNVGAGAGATPLGDGRDSVSDNPYHNQLSMNDGLMKENDILRKGNQQLDDILEMGRETFDELIASNEMIRSFQNKLTGSLDTLGFSQETIKIIEKRAFQDKWLFYGGAILLFVIFWYAISWLR